MARATAKRRGEFTTGRLCAREALGVLGRPAVAILPDARGRPCWPDGITGSITHCRGYRGAALARTSEFRAVGIDAEPNEPLPERVLRRVSGPTERAELAELERHDPLVSWDRLLFSSKEAAYKVLSPLTGRWIGFRQAVVTLDPCGGFRVMPAPGTANGAVPAAGLRGHWRLDNGLLLTAITLEGTRTAPASSGTSVGGATAGRGPAPA